MNTVYRSLTKLIQSEIVKQESSVWKRIRLICHFIYLLFQRNITIFYKKQILQLESQWKGEPPKKLKIKNKLEYYVGLFITGLIFFRRCSVFPLENKFNLYCLSTNFSNWLIITMAIHVGIKLQSFLIAPIRIDIINHTPSLKQKNMLYFYEW